MAVRSGSAWHRMPAVVAVSGCLILALAVWPRRAEGQRTAGGFTVISRQTYTPADGSGAVLLATSVRYQRANGEWKDVTTSYSRGNSVTQEQVTFGRPGRGAFRVDLKTHRLILLSGMAGERHEVTEALLRSDPRFVREEDVLGHRTFVSRITPNDSSDEYFEVYVAPSLQGLPLKRVSTSTGGVEIFEPVNITLGEPGAAQFTDIPDLPVDEEFYRQKQALVKQRGAP